MADRRPPRLPIAFPDRRVVGGSTPTPGHVAPPPVPGAGHTAAPPLHPRVWPAPAASACCPASVASRHRWPPERSRRAPPPSSSPRRQGTARRRRRDIIAVRGGSTSSGNVGTHALRCRQPPSTHTSMSWLKADWPPSRRTPVYPPPTPAPPLRSPLPAPDSALSSASPRPPLRSRLLDASVLPRVRWTTTQPRVRWTTQPRVRWTLSLGAATTSPSFVRRRRTRSVLERDTVRNNREIHTSSPTPTPPRSAGAAAARRVVCHRRGRAGPCVPGGVCSGVPPHGSLGATSHPVEPDLSINSRRSLAGSDTLSWWGRASDRTWGALDLFGSCDEVCSCRVTIL